MRFSPYIALLALLVTGVAQAAPTRQHQVSLRTTLCAQRQILKSRAIPATAQLQSVQAWVNHHEIRGWSEAPRIAGLAGYGVVAQVIFTRKSGPAVVRLASARAVCARVHVVIVWR